MAPNTWETVLYERFPALQSHHVVMKIVQANAVGCIVSLEHSDDSCDSPSSVFIKQVQATDYVSTKKDWADLRRTLMYGRTEARFYRDVLPQLPLLQASAPRVWHVEYDLDPFFADDIPANAPAGPPPPAYTSGGAATDDTITRTTAGVWIVLDCISPATHFQASPLTLNQTRSCLDAAATLHAAMWEQRDLLRLCHTQLSRASFALPLRNPKELVGMERAWQHFATEFAVELRAAGLRDEDERMGRRVQRMARTISDLVLVAPDDPFCTLIHGDYKAMNVFLPQEGTEGSALLVDYASCGIGLGMSDVAMHIHHAVLPEDLDNGGERSLVHFYWESLQSRLGPTGEAYDWEIAWKHYRLGVVDYFRFFLGRMWKDATHATMAKREDNPNVSNINRFPRAAAAYCVRVEQYLTELEEETKYESANSC